jgi:hypothetical protein
VVQNIFATLRDGRGLAVWLSVEGFGFEVFVVKSPKRVTLDTYPTFRPVKVDTRARISHTKIKLRSIACPQVPRRLQTCPTRPVWSQFGAVYAQGEFTGLPSLQSVAIGISLCQTNKWVNSNGFIQQNAGQRAREVPSDRCNNLRAAQLLRGKFSKLKSLF